MIESGLAAGWCAVAFCWPTFPITPVSSANNIFGKVINTGIAVLVLPVDVSHRVHQGQTVQVQIGARDLPGAFVLSDEPGVKSSDEIRLLYGQATTGPGVVAIIGFRPALQIQPYGMQEHGLLTGVLLHIETPGLMAGIADIGYELLRLAAPTRVPAVLLLAPPFVQGTH